MTTRRYSPVWNFIRPGQLWYDWRVDTVRTIYSVFPGGFYAIDPGHGNPGDGLVFSWHRRIPNDNIVVSNWCLLT